MLTPTQKLAFSLYVLLILICTSLMICAEFLSPTVRTSVLPVASDGFKTVFGALVGAISVLAGAGRKS